MLSIRNAFVIGLLAGAAWLAPTAAHAQVPQQLVHQGRLLDRMGAPIAGSQSITYRIYDAASGGTQLWSETLTVTLDDGYFSAQLGLMTPFGATVFNGTQRFLAVAVGTDPEMTPREPVSSVPYALVAGNVNGDITPRSISVGGMTVIDNMGRWVGAAGGPAGPAGPAGPTGPAG
ncbi:MAG: procollagen, type alpha, partial [Myxococcaceae bacterium]|nr:procollagen, type alpha [Myxococcaceae bacterium]